MFYPACRPVQCVHSDDPYPRPVLSVADSSEDLSAPHPKRRKASEAPGSPKTPRERTFATTRIKLDQYQVLSSGPSAASCTVWAGGSNLQRVSASQWGRISVPGRHPGLLSSTAAVGHQWHFGAKILFLNTTR